MIKKCFSSLAVTFLFFLLLGGQRVRAMTASPFPVEVTQPDGTVVTLRIKGDETLNWFVDEAGYTVILDRGQYVYANLDAGGWLASTGLRVGAVNPQAAGLRAGIFPSAQKVSAYRASHSLLAAPAAVQAQAVAVAAEAPSSVSAVGTVKNLVVLCKFSDHDDTKTRAREDYDVIFNTVGGDPTLAPTGSVRDYFTETSYGTVTLQSTVVAWVTLPQTEAYYCNAKSGLGAYPNNGQKMVADALPLVDALVDFGQFDANNDGYVDAIDFIHSGYAAETGGGAGNWMWSHKWSLWAVPGGQWTSADNNGNGVKVKVYDYHTEAALWGTSGTGITRIGVVCHETGHFFGLPDLYDTDGSSEGIGSYCLMANSWGFDFTQQHPPHFSAWCKQQLGWVTPTVITPGHSYSLPRVAYTPTIYRIDSGYPSGEYLLIENRQPTGFETAMPQGGLAIWHIDTNKSNNNDEGYPGQSGWPTNNKHYKVALLQADGLYQMEHDQNRGNAGDVYHAAGVSAITAATVPNTDRYQSGTVVATNNQITNITSAGNTMTFTYRQAVLGSEDFMTELFSGSPHDLDNTTFTFTPNGSDGYTAKRTPVTAYPANPAGGTVLNLADNSFQQVTLTDGKTVSLYGETYGSFYVGSNGYITFNAGLTQSAESLSTHFSVPRISAFFDDLNPAAGGQVIWKQMTDRVAITWNGVSEFGTSNSNSFQVEMFFDGVIRITHLGMAATDGLIGLSQGLGLPVDYVTSDFSAYPLDQDEAPVFSEQPASQTVQVGDTVTMSAQATGGGGITYQWYYGDDAISNATESSYSIAAVLFSQAGSYHVVASNLAGSVSSEVATLTVNKRAATIQLASLSQTYNGSSRVVTATTTPANLTVEILYGESATAPIDAGSYAITATIVDDTYQGSKSGTLNVAKASQSITFPAIGSQVATNTVMLSASGGGSGNAVTFAVSQGPGSISNGVLSFTGAGTVGVVASQVGNSNYNAAPNLERFVTVTKASAEVNLSALSQTYDGTPRVAGVSTTPADLTVDILYNGSATAPTAVGDYAVTATINDARYAGSTSGTLSVTKAGQVITFAAIPDQTAVDTLPLLATGGGSGNPVTFVVTSGPGLITNGTLSFSGAGQVLITASQAGDSNHEAAVNVQRTVNVSKAVGIVTLSALNQTYDSTPRQVVVTTEPEGLAVEILYGESDTAPTQAGQYVVTATLNDEFYEGSSMETLVVAKAAQVISFAEIADQLTTATVPLVATGGGSAAPVSFAVTAGPAQITEGHLSFTAAGEVTVTASQAGDDNHEAAEDVPRSFTVSRAEVSFSFAQTSTYYDGTAKDVQVTTEPEGLPVQTLYNESATLPVEAGDYAVQATVDTALYYAVGSTTLSVLRPRLALERVAEVPLVSGVSTVDLGSVAPETSSSFGFTLRNAGTGLLSNLVATVTGTDAADFAVLGPVDGAVNAAGSTTLEVVFSPQNTGHKNAVLRVASNDFSQPLFTVNLTAFGDHRADRAVMEPETEAALVEAESTLWDDASVGIYDGLLRDAEDEHRLIGAIESLTLAKPKAGSGLGGAVTGKLRFQGKSVTLKGSFDEAGLLVLDLPQKDGSVVTGSLQLMDSAEGKVIRGHVSWLGQDTVAELPRAAYDQKNPVPESLTGSYTMLLPGPEEQTDDTPSGDGWATVSISSTGAVKVSGRLSDGTAFTESAFLSAEADFSLYTELYKATARGQFGGRMVLRDVPDVSDFDGQVQWIKPADAKSAIYPAGFTLEVWALGSHYTAPATGERALSQLEDAEPNASLSLISTALPEDTGSEIEHVLSWQSNNKLVHYGPEKLAGSVNRTQGLLTGSYSDSTGKTRISFLGAVFQKQGLAAGYFLHQGSSGGLRIVPGTDFAYPGSEAVGSMLTLAVAETAEGLAQTESLWDAAAAGTYQGILMGESGPQGGLEKLVVSSGGSFSATLWIQGTRYKIQGAFDASGNAEISVADDIVISLQLVLVDGSEDVYQLTGSVTTGAVTYLVDAQRLPVDAKTNPSPWAGAYTLAVLAAEDNDPNTAPGGDGYGLLKVATSGVCTGSLVLSDGTKSTFAGHVSQGGEWSLYRALYGSKPSGFLAGKLTFRDVAGISDFDGVWQWEKAAGAATYPDGFALTRNVIGSLYQKPAKGQRAWVELEDADHNVWLRLLGPNFSSVAELTALDRALTWSSANKITYYGPEKISVKCTSSTGLVTGSVVDKSQGVNQRFAGVLLQKQSVVTGAYQTKTASGRFLMQARGE